MSLRLRPALLTFALLLCSCAAPKLPQPVAVSPAQPTPPPVPSEVQRDLWAEASQILEQRCVVCHGCYDAPCQLQLGAFEGIERGATKTKVYDATRLLASDPSRLFIDAHGVSAWRGRDFFPVLPEGKHRDPASSLLVRMLELKRKHPLPMGGKLPKGMDVGLDREQVCASNDEFDDLAKEHPTWGMPYALPGLTDAEHETLVNWVKAGTPHIDPPNCTGEVLTQVERWEEFFNEPSLKGQLSARYMYEHLFLASLYFDQVDTQAFFRLVRSRTPTGQDIEEIATRRPFDDPKTERFYYRLRRQRTAPLAKTHMPYALNDARLARWTELFRTSAYEVKRLPSYDPEVASNPFQAFRDLPVRSRYRFMLEEAQFTMMGFIKGPVCRGQVALDVIEDRFWINFVHPDSPILEAEAEFLTKVSDHLDLPAEGGSNGHLVHWLMYARHQKKYLEAKSKFLSKLAKNTKVTLDLIWDGDGSNPNAALTVLRHFDSATVAKGYVGGPPKTSWVVGYALLERIHYLLVAGFDVFGNVGHQINTRLYMDFLRMEAEHNFLLLLPRSRRRTMVERWYRDVRGGIKDQVYGKVASFDQESSVVYQTKQPEEELFAMLYQRFDKILDHRYDLRGTQDEALRKPFDQINCQTGVASSHMPESSYVEVCAGEVDCAYFTISRDSAHTNVAKLFGEDDRRKPKEDHLTVTRGFLGAYPNAIFKVSREELASFVAEIGRLDSNDSYARLRERFGVRRTDPRFWAVSDRMLRAYRSMEPIEAGLFDLNRLEAN